MPAAKPADVRETKMREVGIVSARGTNSPRRAAAMVANIAI
jgi:hypothetical protein